ncbi:DNA polymerase III subunit delta [Aquibaculum arenosum]|uniref:DNA-directed DNA polymerase n=1 Tax=Aquibaculum arenosum TaxID=3032591 RepID=A0ABT5YKK6_9PROT|nr:DNA polymerase III subunit delta [Fodinicurvata sp. CAU 1616]MDF2095437.1 DNA polymerase III subunit delta [Fodinicurvata sp. CAU 1616]
MEIRADQLPSQLPRLVERLRALLFYGPDAGLIAELSGNASRAVLGETADPFRMAELTPAQLRDDPALLADEAAALSLTGGRRVVRLRGAGNELAELLKGFLKDPPGEALLLVEAGDLPKRAALVQAFARADDRAGVVACYRDEGGGIARLATTLLREAGLEANRDALALLSRQLGGDRQLSRREIEKLILYKGGSQDDVPAGTASSRVEVEDVVACIGDGAALDLDDIALAVCDGDTAALDRALRRSFQQGTNAVQILRHVMRHFQRLHFVAAQVAEGTAAKSAMATLQPRPFWKVADRFEAQARSWPPARLAAASARLLDAEAACKRTGSRDTALCGQILLGIALTAPKGRRR